MVETLIDYLSNLIVNELENCAKQNFENYKSERELRKSTDDFKNELENWIKEFINKNETTIINSSNFLRYIENYNPIGHIVEYITAHESTHIDEKTFINYEIEKIIEFLKDNKNTIDSTDRTVIKDFVNCIKKKIKNRFFSKLPIECSTVLYEVNQLRNQISGSKNEVQKNFFQILI